MRGDGATVAGRNLMELTFRTIYQYRNAELQLMTQTLGLPLSPLTPGERKLAEDKNLEPRPQARAWEYWCTRLKKAGEFPAPLKTKSSGKSRAAKAKRKR